ncbi:MAG: hypothetical protein ABJF11_08505 [Reichenbachiella sp.]|uniref:hypothetical protein n=1 Tax=Reichenbachiella sp. TaxID=2184521 RepID=UPI00326523B3
MSELSIFRTYYDPLEVEELIEKLQKHNILFERIFEKSDQLDDYVGSNPFDSKIVISIRKSDFSTAEAILDKNSD